MKILLVFALSLLGALPWTAAGQSRQGLSDDYVCSHGPRDSQATAQACARLRGSGAGTPDDDAPSGGQGPQGDTAPGSSPSGPPGEVARADNRTYSGSIFNITYGQRGSVEFRLTFSGDRVRGDMALQGGLTGAGPVSGTRDGTRCEIRNQAGADLQGVCDEVGFSGTYTVAGQRGRFDTRLVSVNNAAAPAPDYRRSTLPPSVRAVEDEAANRRPNPSWEEAVRATTRGLTAWSNRPPGEAIDGRTFYSVSGLDEGRVRDFLRANLGQVTMLPVRSGTAETIDQKPISEFVLPFCITGSAICHAPYDAIDGAVSVWVQQDRTEFYLYYFSERHGAAYFCKLVGAAMDCRPGGPVGADPRFRLSQIGFQSLFEDLVDSYKQNENRFATAEAVSSGNPDANCLKYDLATHSVWSENRRGQVVPGSTSTSQSYVVRNACSHTLAVVIQQGDAGGCPADLASAVVNALVGTVQRLTLTPGASEDIGPCKGVLTSIRRVGGQPQHRAAPLRSG